jgi:signal peptide peptidase SppA
MKNQLLSRFASGAALVAPQYGDRVLASLISINTGQVQAAAQAQSDFWPSAGDYMSNFRPYCVRDGVLSIPVKGVLLHDFPYAFSSMATGYEYIWEAVKRGVDDSDVKRIAFVVDSPGGEVAGNFDLADYIFAQRGKKPMRALVPDMCFSAAYSLASCADKIIVARTAGVGSIGVVTSHMDMSKMLDDVGLKITFLFAGKHKVDGNPYQPLSSGAKEHIQSQIDELYGVFVRTVARNRGLTEEQVKATEALDYLATEGVSLGLADEVSSLDNAWAAFAADLSPQDILEGDDDMTTQKTPATAAEIAAAASAATAPDQAAIDAARKDGASVAQARMVAIMDLPEANTRRDAAWNVATKTELLVDQAKSLLATLPETKKDERNGDAPAAAGALFSKAMEQNNPEVGAGSGGSGEPSVADRILAARFGSAKAAK